MGYWDLRFQCEGRVWGDKPSKTVSYAIKIFREYNIQKILVPGSGYGRNTESFARSGFSVFGLEISTIAYRMAVQSSKQKGLTINYSIGDLLNMVYSDEAFEGVYCFNTLHLFLKKDRMRIVEETFRVLQPNGLAIFTVFSEKDPSFGAGEEVEPNTFESRRGRPAHYFTEDDLTNHFTSFKILHNKAVFEEENHDPGPHIHVLRLILAQKL